MDGMDGCGIVENQPVDWEIKMLNIKLQVFQAKGAIQILIFVLSYSNPNVSNS